MGLFAFLTFLGIGASTAATIASVVSWAVALTTLAVGVKGYRQLKDMQAQGQVIMANKSSAGGKIPVIYGTRRVGAQVIYMDTHNNDSRDLYVVYALAIGECEEILGRTIELDGNKLTDSARFTEGGYIGSDKISSGSGSLNTVSQNGATVTNAGAGRFGTSPTAQYRYVMNLHHGAATQTADPMLVASMSNWTSAHKLNGVAYIAAHYQWERHGMWSGVPQLTVQVQGKKVYDPRDSGQTFGSPSTYEWSDNPALCFLDYITNNEYGKGLTQSQINMSTFSSAANTAETLVDNPYFGDTEQTFQWQGEAGDDFISIPAGSGNDIRWWQNKIGEDFTLKDSNGNIVLDNVRIKDVDRNRYYGEGTFLEIYFRGELTQDYSLQSNGTSLVKAVRFHCNGYLDTNKNVMENAKELLANMRGIFLYINGQYELSIEDTGTSTFSITDDHIISDAGISVDYGNKDKKANKVIVEFFNANKKYELDTATILHDATPEYYSDDNDEILEIKAEFPYVTDPYVAYNMGKAILVRSRNQTTMQFLGTPEMYKLNVGDIVDLTYIDLGFSGKVCRVEALELQSNGLVAVSLIEYFDVYTWEVPPQEPFEELANLPSAYAVKAPTGLSFTDTDSSSTGRPFLSWDEPTDFPDYQYRVNLVDSSSNQVLNRIVDVTNCDLNFVPVNANYVASVTSLNVSGSESSPATLTFTIGDAPTATADIQNNAITTPLITDNAVTDAKINSLSANKITAGTIDASQITVTNIDADNITTGSLSADNIQIDNVTLDTDGSGNLIIKSGGVGTNQIANNAITTVLINDDAITTAKIIDDAVTNALIATDAVNQDSIAANSVTATEIVANTITASEIAASTITSAQIASNTITAGNIAANTITASEMNVTNLSSISADLGSITGGSINIGSGNFTVDTSGNVVANNISVRGKIRANVTPTGTSQAGLFSELSDTFTGGSDPLLVLNGSDDADKDLFLLVGDDAYNMDFDASGNPTSNNDGLLLFGTGSIFMGSRNSAFGTIEDDSNDLGSPVGRWDDIYATNGTIQTSDANNKSNIANSDLGLNFVSQLTPRKYTLNGGDSSRTHYGLIAQEVKTVLDNNNISTNDFAAYIASEVLDENEQGTGEYKYGLRYTELISILIKAIQELEQRIQDLEN